jgi:hypothetical protein
MYHAILYLVKHFQKWGIIIMAVIKRKKSEAKPSYNKTEMENMQLEFYRVKDQMKLLKKREEDLKKRLDEFMSATLKPDQKGHYLFTVLDEQGNRIHLQKQARKSISLNEERAIPYLEEHGLTQAVVIKEVVAEEVTQDQIIEVLIRHAPHLVVEKVAVDESALEQLVLNEEIPMDEFEGLCDINVTYAMTFIDDKKLQQDKPQEGEENATKSKRKKV